MIIFSIALAGSCQINPQTPSVKHSESTVEAQDKVEEQDNVIAMNNDVAHVDFLNLPVTNTIQGKVLEALLVSYRSFEDNASIPLEKRNITNYDIEVREDDRTFYILFNAHRTKEESELDGGISAAGQDIVFIIDRSTFEIKKWFFVK